MSSPGWPLPPADAGWEAMRAGFRWPRPRRFNIAEVCCDVWARADPDRLALRHLQLDDVVRDYSFADLARASRRLANVLAAHGIARGDRVAVLLPQSPEALLTHLAAYRLGAIVVPLFTLFGEDGLRFRLADSGARALVTDTPNAAKIAAIRADLPGLGLVLSIDGRGEGALDFWRALGWAAETHAGVATGPDDPAFLSYTSGTTGPPKGALHGHRVLLGHLPGISLAHEGLGQPGDRIWTPADWAWMGGLTNVLLPALFYGVTVISHRMPKFDPEAAVALMGRLGARNAFFPPTALNLMRQRGVSSVPGLRTVASAGEALGQSLLDWGRGVFGREINEFYGQTECNAVLGNSAAIAPVRPGSAGRAVPGHRVAILSPEGEHLPPGALGEIAVAAPDPVMFLGYWNNPGKTAEKFRGDWLLTGDEGMMDEDGDVFFRARTDDVITSSGYRIGPGEIEDCLTGHPDVAQAAVVGVPDPIRTEIVKAFVVPKPGARLAGLEAALIARVRARLSAHVAPRSVVFVEALPLTATGKIRRADLRGEG
ncbi:MAG: AMP-dependent synthetase [Rhodovulum sulfidophilum]|uniref:AMP-dependent synthetase n=1 Tax=Rhodovulum sulfidophilum TaxID=35806 RepID=A0A2W5N7A2_RHOSU|nr:MAG: AMP-dependent synthetase [Rhodovulum sulfidophilum]